MTWCWYCKNDHEDLEICKYLKKLQDQRYRKKHREQINQTHREYRHKHPDQFRQYRKNYVNKIEAKAAAVGICRNRYEKYRREYNKMKLRTKTG